MKNLYIIGNGFDCHHGINSSYSAYRQWLEENEPELYERLREFYYVDDDEWWWQFEVNLGEIELADYVQYTVGIGIIMSVRTRQKVKLEVWSMTLKTLSKHGLTLCQRRMEVKR